MKLRIGTLLGAMAKIVGLLIVTPLAVGYSLENLDHDQFTLIVVGFVLLGAFIALVQPKWAEWLWGTPALGGLCVGLGIVLWGIRKSDIVPQVVAAYLGWAAVVFYMSGMLLMFRRRELESPPGAGTHT